jgi:hypothetical protein
MGCLLSLATARFFLCDLCICYLKKLSCLMVSDVHKKTKNRTIFLSLQNVTALSRCVVRHGGDYKNQSHPFVRPCMIVPLDLVRND